MTFSRRRFVRASAAAAAAAATSRVAVAGLQETKPRATAPAVAALKPFPGKAVPITDDERRARIEKARRLMAEHGHAARSSSSRARACAYFVGVRWGTSERPFLLVIPAKGELAYVAPGFEEARAREITRFTDDVRVWQEDEDWGASSSRAS